MKIESTPLAGVNLVTPTVHGDERGFFLETWHADRYTEAGITLPFVQDNHSRSARGILRGLHLQTEKPQGKLVQVLTGSVFDVVVDCRPDSPVSASGMASHSAQRTISSYGCHPVARTDFMY